MPVHHHYAGNIHEQRCVSSYTVNLSTFFFVLECLFTLPIKFNGFLVLGNNQNVWLFQMKSIQFQLIELNQNRIEIPIIVPSLAKTLLDPTVGSHCERKRVAIDWVTSRSGCKINGHIGSGSMYSQAYISTGGSSASVAPCDRVDWKLKHGKHTHIYTPGSREKVKLSSIAQWLPALTAPCKVELCGCVLWGMRWTHVSPTGGDFAGGQKE